MVSLKQIFYHRDSGEQNFNVFDFERDTSCFSGVQNVNVFEFERKTFMFFLFVMTLNASDDFSIRP